MATTATRREGLAELREAIIRTAPEEFLAAPPLVGDLVPAGGWWSW